MSGIRFMVTQLIELAKDGELPEIGQIDYVPTETGGVSVHAHLVDEELNGGIPIHASFDDPEGLRERVELALYAARYMHRELNRKTD